ncbi:hypothetical protein JOM56_013891 [Amanita muscaria]
MMGTAAEKDKSSFHSFPLAWASQTRVLAQFVNLRIFKLKTNLRPRIQLSSASSFLDEINNWSWALNGSGAPGIYNSSVTPDSEYGTYNWCNMPHVRSKEYKTPTGEYKLEYVEVIQRHHKRTPYGSNTFFVEGVEWSCDGSGPVFGAIVEESPVGVEWQAFTDAQNPWATMDSKGAHVNVRNLPHPHSMTRTFTEMTSVPSTSIASVWIRLLTPQRPEYA